MQKTVPDLVKNKKGLSAVVSASLLILLVVVIAALIYSFSVRFQEDKMQTAPQNCLQIQSEEIFKINLVETCYNEITEDLEVHLSRSLLDIEFSEIGFKLSYSDGNTDYWGCGNCKSCTVLEKGNEKKYFLNTEEIPSHVQITADGCDIQKIEVRKC